MSSVLERRRELLRLMRRLTLEKGHFTVHEIAESMDLPRSTVQDWINRLLEEHCLVQRGERRGRSPARYAASSGMPATTCRRIFTTVDDSHVEIYHECMSDGCAAFCEFHHRKAEGALARIRRSGTLLRECARIGGSEVTIGRYPDPAVGVRAVEKKDGMIIQTIRCFGGPAYSLTDMMSLAEGVCDVQVQKQGNMVEGKVITKALDYIVIGVDDTDSAEGGATFALAFALLRYLGEQPAVFPIAHQVVMLYPGIEERTAGNSCSYIEIAADQGLLEQITAQAVRFISDEALSPDWGIAIRRGFVVPPGLREYGKRVRSGRVSRDYAGATAAEHGVMLIGGRGVIGALAAVSLHHIDERVLLDPGAPLD
jgi:hypothetical protein